MPALASDVFNGAFRLTNFLQNLFGEGALSASFIPVYANALEKGDDEEADRIAGAVAAILAMVTAVIVLLGILAAPLATEAIVGGFTGAKFDLTVRLTRILFPGAGIFVMSAWCLGILNSHRRFFLSYAAPVFWNVAMIGALLFFGPRYGEVDLAVALAWASVVGAALQMGVQLPSVFGCVRHPRFGPDIGFAPVREVVKQLPARVRESRRRAAQRRSSTRARERHRRSRASVTAAAERADDLRAADQPVRHGGLRGRAAGDVAREEGPTPPPTRACARA